jgi:hypothetical protein
MEPPFMSESRRPANEAEAIAWLVERVPELRPLLDEHLADNDELLPYVVFESDFLRWFVKSVRAGDDAPAKRFVEAIEPLMTTNINPPANDCVWNLAGVAFVEGLVMQGDVDDVIATARPWMGPNTRRDFDSYHSGDLPPTA